MENKVYLVILLYNAGWESESEQGFRIASTLEKAKEILKEMAEQEKQDSWIYSEKVDTITEKEDYFSAENGEKITKIFIREMAVE